jgi:uncharacterized BrkB/YihY/UPF0761 family membrane protein
MGIMDVYLLLGLLANVGFVMLADWLGYQHFMKHGYDHTLLILLLLNVAIGFGLYYLVFRTLQKRVRLRRQAKAEGRLPLKRTATQL